MYRAALAQDLRYLHQSMKRQQYPSPKNQDTESEETDSDPFFGRLRQLPKMRSFSEHQEALTGLPLDAVQLFLRSEIPEEFFLTEKKAAAAILKTRHDLHFWEPLESLGISQSFHLHRKALEEDSELLKKHSPKMDGRALQSIWLQTSRRLEKALLEED